MRATLHPRAETTLPTHPILWPVIWVPHFLVAAPAAPDRGSNAPRPAPQAGWLDDKQATTYLPKPATLAASNACPTVEPDAPNRRVPQSVGQLGCHLGLSVRFHAWIPLLELST